MEREYNRSGEIPDEAIKEQFRVAREVDFSARPFNSILYRSIAFGDLGWWLPLTRVLPLIGITPQMLRPVFSPRLVVEDKVEMVRVKRLFPLNLFEAFGFLEKKYEKKIEEQIKEIELPEIIETYEELGTFPLSRKPFQELARIFGKPVNVWREDGSTGDHQYLVTVYSFGGIV